MTIDCTVGFLPTHWKVFYVEKLQHGVLLNVIGVIDLVLFGSKPISSQAARIWTYGKYPESCSRSMMAPSPTLQYFPLKVPIL